MVVGSQRECSEEAVEGDVVLLRVEATEANIEEDLGVVNTHLQQAPAQGGGRGKDPRAGRGKDG